MKKINFIILSILMLFSQMSQAHPYRVTCVTPEGTWYGTANSVRVVNEMIFHCWGQLGGASIEDMN